MVQLVSPKRCIHKRFQPLGIVYFIKVKINSKLVDKRKILIQKYKIITNCLNKLPSKTENLLTNCVSFIQINYSTNNMI